MNNYLVFGKMMGLILLTGFLPVVDKPIEDPPTLSIGAAAPPFNLPGVDGKNYSLGSFSKSQILVVIFTCNHCPTAQSYEDRIIKLTADYADKNVSVVAIMPNDPKALRLDEMDFSDLGDSFEDMKIRAKDKNFNFPYLYDGETESASKAYGPIATPHVFVFDRNRKLRYEGRFDDMENHEKTPRVNDARNAIDALLNNREVSTPVTKVFGCSIKWADKIGSVQLALDKWAKEPVSLDTIGLTGIFGLIKNESDKLRLINVWATSNSWSQKEFPEFITMNRMYRDRDFEFISISADPPGSQSQVLGFLKQQEASSKNFLFNSGDLGKKARDIDPDWNGELPFTFLVEPGGKIVFAKQGVIDPAEMKRTIVGNHLIGRYP